MKTLPNYQEGLAIAGAEYEAFRKSGARPAGMFWNPGSGQIAINHSSP
jgi:hypothetical protein